MTRVKIWRVEFNGNSAFNKVILDVVASNAKQAIDKAIQKRKKDDNYDIYKKSVQYVTEVSLLAQED